MERKIINRWGDYKIHGDEPAYAIEGLSGVIDQLRGFETEGNPLVPKSNFVQEGWQQQGWQEPEALGKSYEDFMDKKIDAMKSTTPLKNIPPQIYDKWIKEYKQTQQKRLDRD